MTASLYNTTIKTSAELLAVLQIHRCTLHKTTLKSVKAELQSNFIGCRDLGGDDAKVISVAIDALLAERTKGGYCASAGEVVELIERLQNGAVVASCDVGAPEATAEATNTTNTNTTNTNTTYIYARVSTAKQNLEPQIEKLKTAYPEATVIMEKVSGRDLNRSEFEHMESMLVAGDKVVVYDLSRLGRNTVDLLTLADSWSGRGIGLVVFNLGGETVDTTTATGRLLFTMLAAVGQMQKDLQAEKAAIGMAKAVSEGKMKGGVVYRQKETDHALQLVKQGYTKEHAAKIAGIGVATLYRAIKSESANKTKGAAQESQA
jgi:DNA invertase Pin-like site-specific DNA recombinase